MRYPGASMTSASADRRPLSDEPSESAAPGAGNETSRNRRGGRWWTAPLRWLRRAAASVLAPLRALIRSPWRLAKTIFMATVGRDRGFGFWWLLVTLALAIVLGLILAIVLSPVLGLVAALVVAVWMLVRGRHQSSSDGRSDADGSGSSRASAARG